MRGLRALSVVRIGRHRGMCKAVFATCMWLGLTGGARWSSRTIDDRVERWVRLPERRLHFVTPVEVALAR